MTMQSFSSHFNPMTSKFSNLSNAKLLINTKQLHQKNLNQTKQTSNPLHSVKFGAGDSDAVEFSELKEKSKRYAKQNYQKAKAWLKEKSDNHTQEKKDALKAAGAGVAAGVVAEASIGGLSGGIFGASVAAVTGYFVNKNSKKKRESDTVTS